VHPLLLHPNLLLTLLRNRGPDCPPVAVCDGVADTPTVAAAAHAPAGVEMGLVAGPTAPSETSEEHC